MSMSSEDADSIRNLIGNCYQDIWGSHEEKRNVICKWLKAVQNNPDHSPEIMFDIVLKNTPYRK